mmetsp:Transcript_15174/g.45749  ORF Transcript_15174/g.45749 Transcript_15174/m.45749 type:complete len:208 (-) Transcript_15174:2447-3070(-)
MQISLCRMKGRTAVFHRRRSPAMCQTRCLMMRGRCSRATWAAMMRARICWIMPQQTIGPWSTWMRTRRTVLMQPSWTARVWRTRWEHGWPPSVNCASVTGGRGACLARAVCLALSQRMRTKMTAPPGGSGWTPTTMRTMRMTRRRRASGLRTRGERRGSGWRKSRCSARLPPASAASCSPFPTRRTARSCTTMPSGTCVLPTSSRCT